MNKDLVNLKEGVIGWLFHGGKKGALMLLTASLGVTERPIGSQVGGVKLHGLRRTRCE